MKTDYETAKQQFIDDYLGTALEDFQCTLRDDGEDVELEVENYDDDTLIAMIADATVFWNRNGAYILAREAHNDRGEWTITQRAAHDFWLTRNGHGAGFFDRKDLWGPYTDKFIADAEWFSNCDLYLKDGKIYC